jgi:hypothetical protein
MNNNNNNNNVWSCPPPATVLSLARFPASVTQTACRSLRSIETHKKWLSPFVECRNGQEYPFFARDLAPSLVNITIHPTEKFENIFYPVDISNMHPRCTRKPRRPLSTVAILLSSFNGNVSTYFITSFPKTSNLNKTLFEAIDLLQADRRRDMAKPIYAFLQFFCCVLLKWLKYAHIGLWYFSSHLLK